MAFIINLVATLLSSAKINLQFVLDNSSKLSNGFLWMTTDNSAVKWDLYAIQITSPLNKEVNTVILYDFIESIVVEGGLPPKQAVNDVQKKQMISKGFIFENNIIMLVLHKAMMNVDIKIMSHNSDLKEFVSCNLEHIV